MAGHGMHVHAARAYTWVGGGGWLAQMGNGLAQWGKNVCRVYGRAAAQVQGRVGLGIVHNTGQGGWHRYTCKKVGRAWGWRRARRVARERR